MSPQSRSYRLWSKVLICTGALVAFFLPMPAGHPTTVSAQSGERTRSVHVPAAQQVRAPRLKSPPVVSAEEKARLQAVQAQVHRRGPGTRVNPSAATRAAPPSLPATTPRTAATLAKPRAGSSTSAAGDFVVFQNTDLHTVVSDTTSIVAEPSVANIGSAVLETGNWFAGISTDGGTTFDNIDPRTAFTPPLYGGFCCDQSVLYDPSRDLVFWTLMYASDGTSNIIRLAVAHGETALETDPIFLYRYDFSPQAINYPAGYWYDYPQIALSSNYLYMTANVFEPPFPDVGVPGGPFYETVFIRMPLDGLASQGGFVANVFITGYFNATPVQGATTTMYLATQTADTATMRVYRWPETSDYPTGYNFGHTSYPDPSNPANYTCPVNITQDWCGRLDDRVQTGWLSGGTVAFVWNAPKGAGGFGTFAYPYLQFLFINSFTGTVAGESVMWNPDYAYAYPSAGLNAWGHVAGTLFYGGGTTPPTLAAFIWDNYSSPPYPVIPTAWDVYASPVITSTQGPTSNGWGDYLSTTMDRTSPFSRFIWAATGFTLQGGGTNSYVHPYYLRFGREANDPVTVEANNKPVYFPLLSKFQ